MSRITLLAGLALVLAAAAAPAAILPIEAGPPFVFQDDFSVSSTVVANTDEPRSDKWNVGNPDGNDPGDQINVGGGLLSVNKTAGGDAFVDSDPLTFGIFNTSSQWVTEFSFRVNGNTANDNNVTFIGLVDSDWADFRLHLRDGADDATQFDLLWDDNSLVGALTDNLTRGTFYTVVLHNHVNNVNVRVNDLYIGTSGSGLVTLAGTRGALGDGQGSFFRVGSPSSPPLYSVDFDYLEVGAVSIPEPAAAAMLALGGVILIGKRRS